VDLTFARVAHSLKVQAGTLHYHLGSRANLITGVMNLFYRTLNERIDAGGEERDWKDELRRIVSIWFEIKLEYPGIAQYLGSEDRFRTFQRPWDGERDHGARFMDRVFQLLEDAKLSPTLAAECWYRLAVLTTAVAKDIADLHSPDVHATFLQDRWRQLHGDHPGLAFALPAFSQLDAKAAFIRMADSTIADVAARRHRGKLRYNDAQDAKRRSSRSS
jgi:hypothetical protein